MIDVRKEVFQALFNKSELSKPSCVFLINFFNLLIYTHQDYNFYIDEQEWNKFQLQLIGEILPFDPNQYQDEKPEETGLIVSLNMYSFEHGPYQIGASYESIEEYLRNQALIEIVFPDHSTDYITYCDYDESRGKYIIQTSNGYLFTCSKKSDDPMLQDSIA